MATEENSNLVIQILEFDRLAMRKRITRAMQIIRLRACQFEIVEMGVVIPRPRSPVITVRLSKIEKLVVASMRKVWKAAGAPQPPPPL